ncbi:MAG: NAD(+) synthase [Planctomycetota bacterium]|nr:MAG: NAD(+) synthase [Planctomycetota bacterium]
MKIEISQIEVLPGQPHLNKLKVIHNIQAAKLNSIDLIIFSEMCIPGYIIGDLWEQPDFLQECENCGEEIKKHADGISVIFGNIGLDHSKKNEDGRIRKYNALFFAENKEFLYPNEFEYPFAIKSLLPNYREFDDSRYFHSIEKLSLELNKTVQELINPFKSHLGTFACILCEDGWPQDYSISPLEILNNKSIDLIINISCSPFTLNKNNKRNRIFSEQAQKYNLPIIYVNQIGIQNNGKTLFTFDGQSTIYDKQGNIQTLEPAYQEINYVVEMNDPKSYECKNNKIDPPEIEQIYQCIHYGTKEFLKACKIEKVVIGLSGGIDSALAAAIYAQILPKENLLLVNMPSKYNSNTTKTLSKMMADNLDCFYTQISLSKSVELTKSQVDNLVIKNYSLHEIVLNLSDINLENIQARDRSSRILASIASAFGGAFTSNANKTEATVGYSTLYGDHAGFLANIADLWKFHIYELSHYMNEIVYKSEVIPAGIFNLPPSAELSDQQNVDEGKGDPICYEYHDKLFQSWVEKWERCTPETIAKWYSEDSIQENLQLKHPITSYFKSSSEFIEDLERWWNLYQGMGVAKRIQSPPILAVTRRAFGFDHRESQLKPFYSQNYLKIKNKILNNAQ